MQLSRPDPSPYQIPMVDSPKLSMDAEDPIVKEAFRKNLPFDDFLTTEKRVYRPVRPIVRHVVSAAVQSVLGIHEVRRR